MSLYEYTRIVVRAVRAGESLPAHGGEPERYEAGQIGILSWHKGEERINSPRIRVIWDGTNASREIRFEDIEPIGLERELNRVTVSFPE
jgi:hypothetical protein